MTKYIREEQGYFWWSDEVVPDDHFAPDTGISGVLRIDETGRADLELHDVLTPGANWLTGLRDKEVDLPPEKGIQGILKSDNQYALLLGVFRNGGSFKSSGISFEKYSAFNCLIGTKRFPPTTKQLMFRSLSVSLKGYEDWLRIGAIESNRTKRKLAAVYRPPKDDIYLLEDGKLEVRYDLRGPYWGKQRQSVMTLTEEVSIAYIPKGGCSLEVAKEQYRNLLDLMILLTGADYGFEWPTLLYGKQTRCTFYFWSSKKSDQTSPEWYKCWTNFPGLQESFGDIFSSWRKKRDQFGPGFYLYLSTKRGVAQYAEHRFVSLVWGLESLHRRKETEEKTDSKLTKKIDRILSQVSAGKDRAWLRGQLKHAGEPSLSERLFDTLSQAPLGLKEPNLRTFCTACANLRNDISHFGGQRHTEGYQHSLKDLEEKSEVLSYIYHALLLHEIGVDKQLIAHHVFEGFGSYTATRAFSKAGLQWEYKKPS